MSDIDDFAANVASDIKDDSENFSSIMITLMVISIIINAIRLMMACNLFGRNLEDRIKNPNRLDQILLRRSIKNNLPSEFIHLKDQIQKQILDKSKTLTSTQIQNMVLEVKNDRKN